MNLKLKKRLSEARLTLKAMERTRKTLEESLAYNQAARMDIKRDIAALDLQLHPPTERQVQRRD